MIELIGVVFGIASVYLAARKSVWTWYTGIVNLVCFFITFMEARLYADALLQVFFFGMTLYALTVWSEKRVENEKEIQPIDELNCLFISFPVIGLLTFCFGMFFANVHDWIDVPPASLPYLDAFVASCSIVATFLLAQRKLEAWLWWIIVDLSTIALCITKGLYFVTACYVIFLILAIYGAISWSKKSLHLREVSPDAQGA